MVYYRYFHKRKCTVGHKSHEPCFHVSLMEAGIMTFVTHCTRRDTHSY